MRHIQLTEENLHASLVEACAVLAAGGLVLYPTETVYGVAVDATQADSVSTLLKYKNRPAGKPISVLVASPEAAQELVELNDSARALYARFLPGPLTVVSRSLGVVDARLESEQKTLGIRISSHPVARALADHYQKPVTATSANASGKSRPYTINTALANLSENQKARIDLILDYGELPRRDPSTVIDTTQEVQEVVRAGAYFTDIQPQYISHSESETKAIAQSLMQSAFYQLAEKPVIFALEGEMGVGKTHFAKGVAAQLGVQQMVTSPTYVLMKEYEAAHGVIFVHLDLWRLGKVDPAELGLAEYLKPNHVLVIEWVEPILPYLTGQDAAAFHLFFRETGELTREIVMKEL